MKIEFINTAEDIVAFNLIDYRNTPTARRQTNIFSLLSSIVFALLFFIILFLIYQRLSLLEFLFPLLIAVISYLIINFSIERSIGKQLRKKMDEGKKDPFIGEQYVEISPKGIFGRHAEGEGISYWEAIDKLVETTDYAIFYVSSIRFIPIQRNAFTNENQYREFIETVEKYYNDATGKKLPIFVWK
jgi:hypothetical protein